MSTDGFAAESHPNHQPGSDSMQLPADVLGDGSVGGEMEALAAVMRRLRAENGCPWDRAQTHETLRPYLLEETYEVLAAIDSGDLNELRDELGDLLLQVVFHSQIASESGTFDVADSIRAIREKLIRRHPHIFGDRKLETPEQVRDMWERIKLEDKGEGDELNSVLSGVPKVLPSLTRAFRVQEKMAGVGFDWPDASGALEKLAEEMNELSEAVMSGDRAHAEEELGDLLFSAVNAARLAGFSAEDALRMSTEKVISRFQTIETLTAADGHSVHELNLEELDVYWDKAKELERQVRRP
ncbi:nucleoside triphosphate pyrophosphohydrolase/pyrophosphatase MazG [bacterium BMS3Bbin04]|nr:nucleoside triphosphate pyrophosphohydrolase/pyrophosphatase MazG [bacterium BMS3Bbin04]